VHPLTRRLSALIFVLAPPACDGDVLVGQFEAAPPATTTTTTTTTSDTGAASATSTTGAAGAGACLETECQGRVYLCGNCQDDDQDGLVDAADPDCLGPCHNAEDTYYGSIPGQNGGNCSKDCYFDQDSGGGNDDCAWDQRCDSLEPDPVRCAYDPTIGVGTPPGTCDEALASQSEQCQSTCLPLVPNGCDCFGCCTIVGAPTPVWLGSERDGLGSCTRDTLADPESCRPCTPVTACLNPCDTCELCVGKTELEAGCDEATEEPPQRCPTGAQACGLAGQSPCPLDHYCITGCCVLTIK